MIHKERYVTTASHSASPNNKGRKARKRGGRGIYRNIATGGGGGGLCRDSKESGGTREKKITGNQDGGKRKGRRGTWKIEHAVQ